MSNPNSGGKAIKINPSKDYEKMIQLQLKYLPQQLQAEYANRAQWDPAFIEQAMGTQEKYDPRLAQEQYDALLRRDPQFVQAHQVFGDKVIEALNRGYIDPTRGGLYKAAGQQITGDVLRGRPNKAAMDDITQSILSRSPGLSYGEAQDMATAVYTGQRQEQYKQQQQQLANQFLGQQSESDLALTAGGRYMGTPGLVQMENQIGGVQAPRAFGYVNPQAGAQGLQYGLQTQQAQLANQGLSGGGGNPWTNALQGASTGASYGSVGGGYGAAGGALTGAIAGAFGYPQYSDARLKNKISRTRLKTPDGIEIVEYDYDGKRWRGVIAQEVAKVRPDAVHHYGNGTLGVFYSKLGIELQEVN